MSLKDLYKKIVEYDAYPEETLEKLIASDISDDILEELFKKWDSSPDSEKYDVFLKMTNLLKNLGDLN
jgi:hypothetical protein